MHMNNTTAVWLYFGDISQSAESKLLFLKQPILLGWVLAVMEAFAGYATVFGLPCQLVITRSQETNGSLIFCTCIYMRLAWHVFSPGAVSSIGFSSLRGLMTTVWSKKRVKKKTVLAAFGWHSCQYSIGCLFLRHLWFLNIDCCTEKSCEGDVSQSILVFGVVFVTLLLPSRLRRRWKEGQLLQWSSMIPISCKSKGTKTRVLNFLSAEMC